MMKCVKANVSRCTGRGVRPESQVAEVVVVSSGPSSSIVRIDRILDMDFRGELIIRR